MSQKQDRIPPVFYCPLCEYHVKVRGLRGGIPGQIPQYVEKKCSLCEMESTAAKTGADR